MNDLISVIIPIYNTEDYLDECVESVCNQTYSNLEILLIDDGATDGSGALADKWAAVDGRCKVFHKKNGGLSSARNFGVCRAKGSFIAFIDSDDIMDVCMLERLHQEACAEQVDIVCCGLKRKTSQGEYVIEYCVPSKLFSFEEYLYEMYSQENGKGDNDMFLPLILASNKIYKASIFEEISYPEGRIHEDNAIIHKLAYTAGRIKWINEPLYVYRARDNSIMKSAFSPKRVDDFYAQMERLQFVKDKIFNPKLMDMMVERCVVTGRRYWCKVKKLNVWSKEKMDIFLNDILNVYRTYSKKTTFSMAQKIILFMFLKMNSIYYIIWSLVSDLKVLIRKTKK